MPRQNAHGRRRQLSAVGFVPAALSLGRRAARASLDLLNRALGLVCCLFLSFQSLARSSGLARRRHEYCKAGQQGRAQAAGAYSLRLRCRGNPACPAFFIMASLRTAGIGCAGTLAPFRGCCCLPAYPFSSPAISHRISRMYRRRLGAVVLGTGPCLIPICRRSLREAPRPKEQPYELRLLLRSVRRALKKRETLKAAATETLSRWRACCCVASFMTAI